MYSHEEKKQKSQSIANASSQKQSNSNSSVQFVDNRPEAIAQRIIQAEAKRFSAKENDIESKSQRKLITIANENDVSKQEKQIQQMANFAKSNKNLTSIADPIQMIRASIAAPPVPVQLEGLEAVATAIDIEIAQLGEDAPEVINGFIDMTRITGWRTAYDTNIAALRLLNPGTNSYTLDQIRERSNDMLTAFYRVVINLGNIRNTLNKSLTDYNQLLRQKEAEASAKEKYAKFALDKSDAKEAKVSTKKEVSPYGAQIGKYVEKFEGAVVLVEDNFVVVVEHYQLKHNPDLGVLHAGGSFKGKKGSQLDGGWSAHQSIYAVQILAEAKKVIAAYTKKVSDDTTITLAKSRLADIDAYISISRDGDDWIISYHGNPPD